MPAKGTKKGKRHTRGRYTLNDSFTGIKWGNPFSRPKKVETYYGNKPKQKKKSSNDFDF